MKLTIRNENPADYEAISDVTRKAFLHHPFSRQTEQAIILALRAAGVLTLSLVAEFEGRLVGHIAFSPVTLSDGTKNWFGVGPLSVAPELQKQGIGKALMIEGISKLKKLGAHGCALVGDPAYYPRFGFKNCPSLTYEGIPPQYFFVLPFGSGEPSGIIHFHDGFLATDQSIQPPTHS